MSLQIKKYTRYCNQHCYTLLKKYQFGQQCSTLTQHTVHKCYSVTNTHTAALITCNA